MARKKELGNVRGILVTDLLDFTDDISLISETAQKSGMLHAVGSGRRL
jgi:hypothetical protein